MLMARPFTVSGMLEDSRVLGFLNQSEMAWMGFVPVVMAHCFRVESSRIFGTTVQVLTMNDLRVHLREKLDMTYSTYILREAGKS